MPPLLDELVFWLSDGDLDAHVAVRAAMAHLHLVCIHPFQDGSGRVSRILQSLMLARGGALPAELASIEARLGYDIAGHCFALQAVLSGSCQPTRDASFWVSHCIEAHVEQARIRLAQVRRSAARWSCLVVQRGRGAQHPL